MNIHQPADRWFRAMKKARAAWAKLLKKLYPGFVQPKSPEAGPISTAPVVEAHPTADNA